MRNNPERFIESNTEDSWASYLANLSQHGTWADALVIQAVADAFHMTINIVESNQGFTPCTVISPVAIPGHEPTVINIGHIDELHYVSTIPYNQMVEINVSCTNVGRFAYKSFRLHSGRFAYKIKVVSPTMKY